jgi:hypothetical protein
MNGEFMELVQRQIHQLGKITFDHQVFANDATHHVAHCAELSQRNQRAEVSVVISLEWFFSKPSLNLAVHMGCLLMRSLCSRWDNSLLVRPLPLCTDMRRNLPKQKYLSQEWIAKYSEPQFDLICSSPSLQNSSENRVP